MSVSNKTLAVLLLAAIVVSLGGTFISLNRLGALSTTGYQTYAETNETGFINLSIDRVVRITLQDSDTIDFGQCELKTNSDGLLINSEKGEDTVGYCDGAVNDSTSGIPIAVRNVGNVGVSVNFNVSDVGTDEGGDFLRTGDAALGLDDSSIRIKLINDGWDAFAGQGGCSGNFLGTASNDPTDYTVLGTVAGHTTALGANACSNLTSGSLNSFLAHFEIKVPDSASEGDEVTITFIAESFD